MYDVLIAGGGATGLTLAIALKHSGLKIAIVEATEYQANAPHPGFDARAIALAKYSQQMLDEFGLNISQIGTAIRHIKVTDQGHLGQCYLNHDEYQTDALGFVVEMQDFGSQLRNALPESIDWLCPDAICALDYSQDAVHATLKSGNTVSARLLVVAEGAYSPTAELAGASFVADDYQQTALIANVGMAEPHQHWAYERFTQTGPLALLPMSQQRMSLVWTLDAARAAHLQQASEQEFIQQLQQAFGYAAGEIIKVGERFTYPLSLVTASPTVMHRTVLIGNCAHTLHPIAGQGFNLGLRDVVDLAAVLQNKQHGLGSYAQLRAYALARKPDQDKVIGLTDALVRLFSNNHWPLVIGRNLGLTLMNQLPGLRHQLATQAMGLFAQATQQTHGE